MVAAAQKNRPLVKVAVPALRKPCGAAGIQLAGKAAPPLCTAPESGGAYHVAGMDRCDCFNRSFLCSAVLPDVFFRLAGSE